MAFDLVEANMLAWSGVDNLRGAALPRFYFTRLIPTVFEDVPANDTYEMHDTLMWYRAAAGKRSVDEVYDQITSVLRDVALNLMPG